MFAVVTQRRTRARARAYIFFFNFILARGVFRYLRSHGKRLFAFVEIAFKRFEYFIRENSIKSRSLLDITLLSLNPI